MKTNAQELREHREAMLRARQARLAGVQGLAGGRVSTAAPNRRRPGSGAGFVGGADIGGGGAGGGAGFTSTLLRPAAQTIAVGGSALSFTEVSAAARASGLTVTPPDSTITIPFTRIVTVLVRFNWASPWRAGGAVQLKRDGVVVDESPSSWGPRFAGVLHAGLVNAGEAISIVVDHEDGSTHDVENVVAAVKVEGAAISSLTDGPVAGFYHLAVGDGALALTRTDAAGTTTLESIVSPNLTAGVFYWLRARVVGQQVMGRWWEDGDPEPSTWQVSGTDDGAPLLPGAAGVAAGTAAGGSTRDYDTLAVSHAGAAFVAEDFSALATAAGIPAGWERIYRSSTNWAVVASGSFADGKALRHVADGVGSHLVWSGGGEGTDQEVLCRGRVASGLLALGTSFRGTSLL